MAFRWSGRNVEWSVSVGRRLTGWGIIFVSGPTAAAQHSGTHVMPSPTERSCSAGSGRAGRKGPRSCESAWAGTRAAPVHEERSRGSRWSIAAAVADVCWPWGTGRVLGDVIGTSFRYEGHRVAELSAPQRHQEPRTLPGRRRGRATRSEIRSSFATHSDSHCWRARHTSATELSASSKLGDRTPGGFVLCHPHQDFIGRRVRYHASTGPRTHHACSPEV